MKLINCPDCNHLVSPSASVCPSCGRPFIRKDSSTTVIVHGIILAICTFPWLFLLGFFIFYHGLGMESWVAPSFLFTIGVGLLAAYLFRYR
jgi:hypothetical protein